MFQELDISKISNEINFLSLRIQDRFPNASLLNVCRKLNKLSNKGRENIIEINKPYILFRTFFWLLVTISFLLVIYTIFNQKNKIPDFPKFENFIQTTEAFLNEMVMIFAAFYFLFKLEDYLKQKKTLKALQELRTIIHIIDMHQLTKDPEILLQEKTAHSPTRTLTKKELNRYLNYCIEMLSLTSKVAAAYGKNCNDQLILDEIHNIESLSSLLSNKIWQKININNLYENA